MIVSKAISDLNLKDCAIKILNLYHQQAQTSKCESGPEGGLANAVSVQKSTHTVLCQTTRTPCSRYHYLLWLERLAKTHSVPQQMKSDCYLYRSRSIIPAQPSKQSKLFYSKFLLFGVVIVEVPHCRRYHIVGRSEKGCIRRRPLLSLKHLYWMGRPFLHIYCRLWYAQCVHICGTLSAHLCYT